MKILITGAAGQLGCALQAALGSHEVIALDSPHLDIADAEQVAVAISKHTPELVINVAAYTKVDDAESDIDLAYRVNELGAENLARTTAAQDISMIHISTDYVFDGSGNRPWLESDEPNPLSVYGKSKLAGELAVKRENPRHFIVRTAWLYHISGMNFLRTMFRLAEREEVKVVNDQFGSPTNADDLADALQQLFISQAYGTYHLVNQGSASWYELTHEFYRQLGIQTPVIPVTTDEFPRPAPRPANSVLGTTWLDEDGKPSIQLPSWQQGVERLVKQLPADWSQDS